MWLSDIAVHLQQPNSPPHDYLRARNSYLNMAHAVDAEMKKKKHMKIDSFFPNTQVMRYNSSLHRCPNILHRFAFTVSNFPNIPKKMPTICYVACILEPIYFHFHTLRLQFPATVAKVRKFVPTLRFNQSWRSPKVVALFLLQTLVAM